MTLERATLVSLCVLIGLPALTLAEALVLTRVPLLLLLINAAASIAAAYLIPSARLNANNAAPMSRAPLLAAFIIQAVVVAATTTAYLALPDVDPYHWLKFFEEKFSLPLAILPHRPFFPALLYAATRLTGLSAMTTIKYGLPLLSMLVLMPLWLVARRLPAPAAQLTLLFLPLYSPSLILHAQMGTPQAILLILAFFFTACLLHASLTRQRIWHYAAGLISLAAIPYHGLSALLLAVWALATAFRSRYRSVLFTLIAAIALAGFPYVRSFWPAAVRDIRPNLTFPASFTTIDGVPNGWPGISGFIHYYSYYAGLEIPLLLAVVAFLAYRSAAFRQSLRALIIDPSSLTLMLGLLAFASIAELMPRFMNIAILPERAWLFIPLTATVLFLPLWQLPVEQQKWLWRAVLVVLAINLGGAHYVNSLKAYSLPDHTIRASRWISANLPAQSVVLTTHGPDYLDRYAPVSFRALHKDFYCEHHADSASELRSALVADTSEPAPVALYVFFARQDPRQPYANRPWQEPLYPECDVPLPSQFPNTFQELYNDSDKAIVWLLK